MWCLGAISVYGIVKIVYEKIKLHCPGSFTGIFAYSLLIEPQDGYGFGCENVWIQNMYTIVCCFVG